MAVKRSGLLVKRGDAKKWVSRKKATRREVQKEGRATKHRARFARSVADNLSVPESS